MVIEVAPKILVVPEIMEANRIMMIRITLIITPYLSKAWVKMLHKIKFLTTSSRLALLR